MADLKNKCCLVTGGSKGIGKGIVESLAAAGAKVFTCSRNQSELDEVVSECTSKGWEVHGCACDVMDKAALENLIEQVVLRFDGKLHVLVNNAGINAIKRIIDYDDNDKDYHRIMEINLASVYRLCKLCYPLFKASGEGNIVNIGTAGAGYRAMDLGVPYVISKGALHQFTICLANEWAGENIRVNCVAPGYIPTPLTYKFLEQEKTKEAISREVPMKRPGTVEEIANTVIFFCSKQSAYVTGQVLYVDGGYISRGAGF